MRGAAPYTQPPRRLALGHSQPLWVGRAAAARARLVAPHGTPAPHAHDVHGVHGELSADARKSPSWCPKWVPPACHSSLPQGHSKGSAHKQRLSAAFSAAHLQSSKRSSSWDTCSTKARNSLPTSPHSGTRLAPTFQRPRPGFDALARPGADLRACDSGRRHCRSVTCLDT